MTSCPSLEELAVLVDDGPDASTVADPVTTHVTTCAVCSEVVAALRSDAGLLRFVPDVSDEAIDQLHENVMRRLSRHRAKRLGWTAAVAAGLCLAALLPTWFQEVPKPNGATLSVNLPTLAATSPDIPAARRVRTKRTNRPKRSGLDDLAQMERRFERPRPVATAPAGTEVFTIRTSNPGVVIVLFDEKTGGAE